MNRSEFIAQYQAKPVMWGLIELAAKGHIPSQPISSRELKDILDEHYEARVTVPSIEAAVSQEHHKYATVISDAGKYLMIEFNPLDVQVVREAGLRNPESFLNRLLKVGPIEFRRELSRQQKVAREELSQPWREDETDHKLPVGHGWEADFEVLKGLVMPDNIAAKSSSHATRRFSLKKASDLLSPEWLTVYIGIGAIIVALWIGEKI